MPTVVHRVEVRMKPGELDPRGVAACRAALALGPPQTPSKIETAAVYLIQGHLGEEQVRQLADILLADPVMETATIGAAPCGADALIEVHPLPGVMDPDAEAVESAIRTMLGADVQVRTARRYDMHGVDGAMARRVAEGSLANPVIHAIHEKPYLPEAFRAGTVHRLRVAQVVIEDMDDQALASLSRDAHLFLSVGEMRAIQAEYRRLGRDPRETELETIAQTWSEHCVHKTLKSQVTYRGPDAEAWSSRPGHELSADGSVAISNLLKCTVVAATEQLIADGVDWCLSVFVDNAGVIAFDDEQAVCFKVETHNHPSALEPYGGAATGIGGCIRDIIGTGLAARPIASTDVFCVAHPDRWPHERLPEGCLHPKRILTQIVAGVRDYGNRMGIPTLNGAVWFDDRYVGNPLVFCGCIGVMPRDMITGEPVDGDRIVVLGGRTGRDGIHGATFSSAELTGTHADEFSHAVQIGNPVTEKKLLEAVLQARDEHLYHAITDCGAGGFSSAVGEMGRRLGAEVHLERAPLKYAGLSPTEIWISEAQERMVLAVPPASLERLRAICELNDVEMCELGHYGTEACDLILRYHRTEVGRLSMSFLHDGLPRTGREAIWERRDDRTHDFAVRATQAVPPTLRVALLRLLAHPNIASKRWIIRQYDHEVQGGSVVTPLVGPAGEGPSDAAVIAPVHGSPRGLAVANGLATGLSEDPYVMVLAAIDECVRNLVCEGADAARIALLDNFCWPSCNDSRRMGELVRAAEACYEGALAYRAPFISGKDSLNNQFTAGDGTTIEIPPTLLISGMGAVPDVTRCVTMDAKAAGNHLLLVGEIGSRLGGSHYEMLFGPAGDRQVPVTDLERGPRIARKVHAAIADGLVASAHDCSDGGLLVAAAEMALAGGLGLELETIEPASCFCEEPSRYLLEVAPDKLRSARAYLDGVPCVVLGSFNDSGYLAMAGEELNVAVGELLAAWPGTLDW
jgi:phosphoribosylformylglycinamidine synthase